MHWPQWTMIALMAVWFVIDISRANGWKPKEELGPAGYGFRSLFRPILVSGILYQSGFFSQQI